MSLFRKPPKPRGLTFLLHGEPGTGKTRFALGLSRLTNKPVAVLGTDRGAALYGGDPVFGDFVHVETRDVTAIDAAIGELGVRALAFGGVVVDTISDWWRSAQQSHEVEREGRTVVPMRSWRLVRNDHERRLRALQCLGMHVILISEDRPVFEKRGDELFEIGAREDTDKKDGYLADVRLRLFAKEGRTYAEVQKDRTGRYAMGAVVEDPSVELWLGPTSATAPAGREHPLEPLARELIDHLGEIHSAASWTRWRRKHAKTLAALFRSLPDSPTKRKLIAIGRAKKSQYEPRTTHPRATA